jgi:Na+-driven multidrug efflux pump
MFQALGNTLPALAASFVRILVTGVPAALLSTVPGFQLHWVWYLSAGTVWFQVVVILLLLQREFRLRLPPEEKLATAPAPART